MNDLITDTVADRECEKNGFSPAIDAPLDWLADPLSGGVLGRTESRHRQFGADGLGLLGRLSENDREDRVQIDLLEPHVILLNGVRGSGKSYTQGVLIEEIGKCGLQIGTVVVDRCGVFPGLKHPNPDADDVDLLSEYDFSPSALENVRIFSPGRSRAGAVLFRLTVADMTADDWVQFWSINPEGPQGSLVRDLLRFVRSGYMRDDGTKIHGLETYALENMEECLLSAKKLQSRYKSQTLHSIEQRLASTYGLELFEKKGTSMEELSVAGQVSVLDLSDSSVDNICAAKIVGLLARKILHLRQDSVRDGTNHIPVTWLVVDEAHLYVGEDAQNGSAADLISYCKLGRRPGCALVLGTQQPSAMNKGVLSQADIVISHQLVLESDITALKRIIPATMPRQMFGDSSLIRRLPPGVAIVADKLTQERPIIARIRPRSTRHDGGSSLPAVLGEEDVPVLVEQVEQDSAVEAPILCQKKRNEPILVSEVKPDDEEEMSDRDSSAREESISGRADAPKLKDAVGIFGLWLWNRLDV